MPFDDSKSANKRVTNKEDRFTQKDLIYIFYIYISIIISVL